MSNETGMSTVPPAVTAVETLMVIVGCVGSVSTDVVTPVGETMLALDTLAGICSVPRIAITVVVVLLASAALTPPGNVCDSFVRMTDTPSVRSTTVSWSELFIAILLPP